MGPASSDMANMQVKKTTTETHEVRTEIMQQAPTDGKHPVQTPETSAKPPMIQWKKTTTEKGVVWTESTEETPIHGKMPETNIKPPLSIKIEDSVVEGPKPVRAFKNLSPSPGLSTDRLKRLTLLCPSHGGEHAYVPSLKEVTTGETVRSKLAPLKVPKLLRDDVRKLLGMQEPRRARKWLKMCFTASPETIVDLRVLYEHYAQTFYKPATAAEPLGPCTFLRTLLRATDGSEPFAVSKEAHMLVFGLTPRLEALTFQSTDLTSRLNQLPPSNSGQRNIFAQHLAADPLFPLPPGQESKWYGRLMERNRLPQAEYYALNTEDAAFPGVSVRRLKQLREAERVLEEACERETAAETDAKIVAEFAEWRGSRGEKSAQDQVEEAKGTTAAESVREVQQMGTWAQGEFERREAAKMKPKRKKKKGKKR